MKIPMITMGVLMVVIAGCKGPESSPGRYSKKETARAGAVASGGETPERVPVNKVCPIMEESVDPAASRIEYKGHWIGVCCDECIPDWKGLSPSLRAGFMAEVLGSGIIRR